MPPQEERESEAAILVQAYSDGNAALDASHATVGPACEAMERAYWNANNEIEELQRYASIKYALEARRHVHQVSVRHAEDGPEDRRRQPWWAKEWLVWTAVLLSALYDTVFLADVLQQMLDLSGVLSVFAYLPGAGIAVGLVVTGNLLATAYSRYALKAERKPTRKLFGWVRHRAPGDLPWPMWGLALLFGLAFLGTLAIWARNRAYLSSIDELDWPLAKFEYHIAALLVLLTVAALALKVISHNPFAASAKEADLRMRQARADAAGLRGKVVQAVAEHANAWTRLEGLLANARSQAERFVEAGRAKILEMRAERVVPGKPMADTMTPMTVGLWPPDGDQQPPVTVDLASELRLHYEVLDYAQDLSDKHCPEDLEEMLSKADEELRRQFAVEEPGDNEEAPQASDEETPS